MPKPVYTLEEARTLARCGPPNLTAYPRQLLEWLCDELAAVTAAIHDLQEESVAYRAGKKDGVLLEREACYLLARHEQHRYEHENDVTTYGARIAADRIAVLIRERGEKKA